MTTLVIARHGNTFEAGQTARRIGARTDLPLTEEGRAQAQRIGAWLKSQRLVPDVTYTSKLRRTIETGQIAAREAGYRQPAYQLDIFNEIDYGPDENMTEADVIARIGADALRRWDEDAVVPDGWKADPAIITRNWVDFAAHIRAHDDGETILAVTSNGIARFAPCIAGDLGEFSRLHGLKLATGAICVFDYDGGWILRHWNLRP